MTQIVEEDNGVKKVIKKALSQKSKKHLSDIFDNYRKLNQELCGTVFCINKVKEEQYGLCFEYVDGPSLESMINEVSEKQDLEEIIGLFNEYSDNIRALASEDFYITEEFTQFFGNFNVSKPLKSCKVTNIDMILSNIIVNERWNVIDYEWVFQFPIPVNYILYRAIMYSNLIDKLTIFNMLKISEDELLAYRKMENHFQAIVRGKEVIMSDHVLQLVSLCDLRINSITLGEKCFELKQLENSIAHLKENQDKLQSLLYFEKRKCKELEEQVTQIMNSNGMRLLKLYYRLRDKILH